MEYLLRKGYATGGSSRRSVTRYWKGVNCRTAYALQMDTKQIDTGQLVEWIELERRCCPFFGFEVHWDRKNEPVWLYLTGPEGVKDFILDEFGLR
jgi:hypothetical protein